MLKPCEPVVRVGQLMTAANLCREAVRLNEHENISTFKADTLQCVKDDKGMQL